MLRKIKFTFIYFDVVVEHAYLTWLILPKKNLVNSKMPELIEKVVCCMHC
jgi:hypothetical protein